MTQRETGFLLIGLSVGLLLSVAAFVELVLLFHHMFIMGVTGKGAFVLVGLPIFLIIVGLVLLYRTRTG